MKKTLIVLLLIVTVFGCDQNKKDTKSKPAATASEKPQVKTVPAEIKELAVFAGIDVTEEEDFNSVFSIKSIDQNATVKQLDLDKGIELYKHISKGKQPENYPIFEITSKQQAILLVSGVGYNDSIWATLLIDKPNKTIIKIAFNHIAESEGYGDQITLSSFEKQFENIPISFDSNTFALKQNNSLLIPGDKPVDGITGATVTTKASIEMINKALKRHKNYFK